jgi:hypothetical protein
MAGFDATYQDAGSTVDLTCHTCGNDFSTTWRSYKSAKKTGCPHCKKVTTSQTHRGKVVSAETRRLIGEKASVRPGSLTGQFGQDHPRFTGGYGRNLQERSTLDYVWLNGVRKVCKNRCVVTGEKEGLEAHHLDSWNVNVNSRYDISNGVLLKKEIHRKFHNMYKYGNNTEAQFAEFLQKEFGKNWEVLKKALHKHSTSSNEPCCE